MPEVPFILLGFSLSPSLTIGIILPLKRAQPNNALTPTKSMTSNQLSKYETS